MVADLRYAWRALRAMPVVSFVVVVSLGVGIGVNTAVFSWVQSVMLRPLPGVANSATLNHVEPRAETGSYPGVSWREYGDLRERLRSFSDLLAYRMVPFSVGERGRVERAFALLVSGNYFTALGLKPALGRFFRADEASQPGGAPVVVVSYDYWRSHLHGDAAAIGREIRVNDQLLTIVGVTPARFQGTALGLNFDMWAPATLAPVLVSGSRELEDRSLRGYGVLGRLAPRVSLAQARAEVERTMGDLARAYPDTNANLTAEVLPFWLAPRGPQRMLATALLILQGVMLLLLLAVCANTANLMLARATVRQREIGVRVALGAGRARIARLLIVENMMLAGIGAALGVAIASWATNAMRAVPFISMFPIRFQTDLDIVSLAFVTVLGIGCGACFGIGPALQLARVDPLAAIRSGVSSAGRNPLRHLLMAGEVGLALFVLLVAAMFLRSFGDTRETDPGFRREGVLLAAYDMSARNMDWPATRDFTRRLLERLRALPGVESAAVASSVPLDIHGLPMRAFTVDGHARPDGGTDVALTNTVTPGYFKTMGISIEQGTDFAELSDAAAPQQAIVNQEFVRRFATDGQPLGRRVRTRGVDFVIAGVVRNSLSESFGEPPTPVIYLSYRDRPSSRGEIHVRTRAGSEALLGPEIERLVRDLDAGLPIYNIRTLTDHVEQNLFLRRIPARMFVVLGPALLLLASMGIYAVVAYSVSRRTREIGVRLALGATAERVLTDIVGESLRIVTAGAAVAWVVAVLIKVHLVRGPMYLSVFVGVPALLLFVAAAACWLPAWRATRIDPVAALRQE
jgi:putative ABC transport system permease protein